MIAVGDETVVTEYEKRVEDFDVHQWWANSNSIQTPLGIQSKKMARPDISQFHNPYAGVHCAWQLTETIDDFLVRLPPSTTNDIEVGPWIFICNPYIHRKSKMEAQSQYVKGCEDEAPEEDGTDLLRFCQGGMERLNLVTKLVDHVNQASVTPVMRTREKNKASLDASRDILALAHALHVRAGKWMIFCSMHKVDEIWEIIARATASNELGIAAKVAARSETDPRKERLICVYTADFADAADVERVALKIKHLGLIPSRGKPLYYKPGSKHCSALEEYSTDNLADAYTYLGIGSGNAWGVKASIYNSKDMFGNA
jgi:hypothetical protein